MKAKKKKDKSHIQQSYYLEGFKDGLQFATRQIESMVEVNLPKALKKKKKSPAPKKKAAVRKKKK